MYICITCIGTGIVYETPDLPCGTPREFFPLAQLENNLVVMETTTAHIGHQISGIDETLLLKKIDMVVIAMMMRAGDHPLLNYLSLV